MRTFWAGLVRGLFMATVVAVVASTRAADDWIVRHTEEGGAQLWSLCEGPERLVSVGTEGTILYSSNGEDWTKATSGTTEWLVGVTYGKGQYVAVGASATILTSVDGATWTKVKNVGTTVRLNNVAYADGRFVAVGEAGVILTSTDGTTWEQTPSNTSNWLRGLCYSNGIWVTAGSGGVLVYSTDGKRWALSGTPSDTTVNVEAITPDTVSDYAVLFQAVGGSTSGTGYTFSIMVSRNATPESVGYSYLSVYYWLSTYQRAVAKDRLGSYTLGVDGGIYRYSQGVTYSAPVLVTPVATSFAGGAYGKDHFWAVGSNATIVSSPAMVSTRMANISSRTTVGPGEKTLIAGTIVRGGPKQFLIRGVGPTLAKYNVPNAIAAPQLTVYLADGTPLASNDGWTKNPNPDSLKTLATKVGAFDLNEASADAALVLTLEPGIYTFQVTNKGGNTGSGLVEVYDTDTEQMKAEHLVNVSSRGYVSGGDDVMIGGFIVAGRGMRQVLIRGAGPSLKPLGIQAPLADPVIRVYQGQTLVAENDTWNSDSAGAGTADAIRAAGAQVGAFGFLADGKDAALLLNLPPGAYTVHLGSKDATGGIALIEAYEVLTLPDR